RDPRRDAGLGPIRRSPIRIGWGFVLSITTHALGRLPWLALFLRRARRLRPVLPMVSSSEVSTAYCLTAGPPTSNRGSGLGESTEEALAVDDDPADLTVPDQGPVSIMGGDVEGHHPSVARRDGRGRGDRRAHGAGRQVPDLDPGSDARPGVVQIEGGTGRLL